MILALFTIYLLIVLETVKRHLLNLLKINIILKVLLVNFILLTNIQAQTLKRVLILDRNMEIMLPSTSTLISKNFAVEHPTIDNVAFRVINNNLFFASRRSLNSTDKYSLSKNLRYYITVSSEKYDSILVFNKRIDKRENSIEFSYKILKKVKGKVLYSTEKYWFGSQMSYTVQIFWDNIYLKKQNVERIISSIKIMNR